MTSKLRLLRRKGISALWLVLLLMSSIIFLLGCGLVFSARGVRRSFEESQTIHRGPRARSARRKMTRVGTLFTSPMSVIHPSR